MERLDILEAYFVKLHQHFGITEIGYKDRVLQIDEKYLRSMVFCCQDFNEEFDNLLEHCQRVHQELNRDFRLKIRRDMNNNYFVLVA